MYIDALFIYSLVGLFQAGLFKMRNQSA